MSNYLERVNDLELHADLEHEIWASWMRYMFRQGTFNPDGTWTMPVEKVERWTRQMKTPYTELSDHEKASDRMQVLKHWYANEWGAVMRDEGTEYEGEL